MPKSNKEKVNSIKKQIDEFKTKLINEYEETKKNTINSKYESN